MSTYSPDLSLRQPLTLVAILPLLLSYHALAVLTILPNTFVFKLLLLPFILWQAWKCAIEVDCGVPLAQLLGHQGTDRIAFWNFVFVVRFPRRWCLLVVILLISRVQGSVFSTALKAIEWTFTKKPLRRYDPPERNQDAPIERRLSASTIILDSFELLCNQRGYGWSWSQDPFPRESTPLPSKSLLLVKTLVKLTLFDASQYIIQRFSPATNNPKGGSIFDPNLTPVPRFALAAFCGIWGGIWTYAMVDSLYHVLATIARIVFRQPASMWPRLFHWPWMSTSIHELWSYRWHQLYRHLFIVFGSRPGGSLFGKPGAFMGAFIMSAVLHHIGVWGIGNGTEFLTTGGFFLLMGAGAVAEIAFAKATGSRVRGWMGWLWTMLWFALCGTFMIDGWARRGLFAAEILPSGFRPGKVVVEAIIALTNK